MELPHDYRNPCLPDAPSATSDFPPDQHTLGRSILLHLLPGASILVAYLVLYPLTGAVILEGGLALVLWKYELVRNKPTANPPRAR